MGLLLKFITKNSNVRKDGTTQVYLLIRINSLDRLHPTNQYLLPKYFDKEKGIVKSAMSGSMKINLVLEDFKRKYSDTILELQLSGKPITHESIADKINIGSGTGFISFCERELEFNKLLVAEKHYEEMRRHIKFLKIYCGEANINSIDLDFLQKLEQYFIKRGNKPNTISIYLRTYRRFFNIALKKGVTNNYPFKFYKFKQVEVIKQYLTMNEIEMLDNLYFNGNLPERLKNTLYYFLVSCYTGLRMSDCRDINKATKENNMIILKTKKKDKVVYIPISNRAAKLFANKVERTLKIKKSRISEDIQEIMNLIKVKKHITFHCARHTFAINSLVLGIPIEVVSDILGHSSIKTTQIYAKIVNEHKQNEMLKWNI